MAVNSSCIDSLNMLRLEKSRRVHQEKLNAQLWGISDYIHRICSDNDFNPSFYRQSWLLAVLWGRSGRGEGGRSVHSQDYRTPEFHVDTGGEVVVTNRDRRDNNLAELLLGMPAL